MVARDREAFGWDAGYVSGVDVTISRTNAFIITFYICEKFDSFLTSIIKIPF